MQELFKRARKKSWMIEGNTLRCERKPSLRSIRVLNSLHFCHFGRLFDEIVADERTININARESRDSPVKGCGTVPSGLRHQQFPTSSVSWKYCEFMAVVSRVQFASAVIHALARYSGTIPRAFVWCKWLIRVKTAY